VAKPRDPVKVMARPFVPELARPSKLESDLESEDCLEKLEARVRDPVRPLDNAVCSAKLEAKVSELVSVLKMEFFGAELALRTSEPVRVLRREFFAASPEAVVMEEVGFSAHVVAAPACRVQETGVVFAA